MKRYIQPLDAMIMFIHKNIQAINNKRLNGMLYNHSARSKAKLLKGEKNMNDKYHKFFNFFHLVNDGLGIVDFTPGTPDTYLEVNDSYCRMLGYTREEMLKLSPIDLCAPSYRNTLKKFIRHTKGGKERIAIKEAHFTRKDGKIIIFELNSHIVEMDGKLIGFGVHHDITKRKEMEKKLKEKYKSEANLRKKLELQMEQKIEFTRALVHELRTPLTPILCNCKTLSEMTEKGISLDLVSNIYRSATNLNSRVDELMDSARGELGTLKIVKNEINARKILEEIYEEFTLKIEVYRQTLHLNIGKNVSEITADGKRLKQIIWNLLENASKYSPEGTCIYLNAKMIKQGLKIEVKDFGSGIADNEKQKIFESYYQSKRNVKSTTGLGLGLALCKKLIELHGGHIIVKDSKPNGSIFAFTIPNAQA